MLLEFKMKNFTSFRNEETFSMVASEMVNEFQENRIELEEDFHLLKTASIFGANASGKSNLLKALKFMIFFIEKSMIYSKEGKRNVTHFAFSLDDISEENPTNFELSFSMREQIVTYSFSMKKGDVISEKLIVDDHLIFDRNLFKIINYSKDVFKTDDELELKFSLTNTNSLFLTVLSVTNTKVAEDIVKYLNENIVFFSGLDENNKLTKTLVMENDRNKSTMLNLLKVIDFNIVDLEVQENEVDIDKWMDDDIPKELIEVAREHAKRLLARHNVYDLEGKIIGNRTLDVDKFESSGTKVFLSLLGPIISVLEQGGVLVIDEVDALLHPLVTRYLIEMFNDKRNTRSQMIITSHNSNILDQKLLRKDQIWLVEKDELEVSHLTALSEYKFEESDTYEYAKNYLRGKYGAIPYIKELIGDVFIDILGD